VGESGSVVGVDMTEEQLSPALASTDFHRAAFGYLAANTTFHVGFIERLDEIQGLERGTFDLIVSNCVVNLSPDKEGVLRQAYDLLKPGALQCSSYLQFSCFTMCC
jgi:SAM-dependent methyltransferase